MRVSDLLCKCFDKQKKIKEKKTEKCIREDNVKIKYFFNQIRRKKKMQSTLK